MVIWISAEWEPFFQANQFSYQTMERRLERRISTSRFVSRTEPLRRESDFAWKWTTEVDLGRSSEFSKRTTSWSVNPAPFKFFQVGDDSESTKIELGPLLAESECFVRVGVTAKDPCKLFRVTRVEPGSLRHIDYEDVCWGPVDACRRRNTRVTEFSVSWIPIVKRDRCITGDITIARAKPASLIHNLEKPTLSRYHFRGERKSWL